MSLRRYVRELLERVPEPFRKYVVPASVCSLIFLVFSSPSVKLGIFRAACVVAVIVTLINIRGLPKTREGAISRRWFAGAVAVLVFSLFLHAPAPRKVSSEVPPAEESQVIRTVETTQPEPPVSEPVTPTSQNTSPTPLSSIEHTQEEAPASFSTSSPEFMLAALNLGRPPEDGDRWIVQEFSNILNSIRAKSGTKDRMRISDMIVKGQSILRDEHGIRIGLLQFARELDYALPEEAAEAQVNFAEIVASVITLKVAGR